MKEALRADASVGRPDDLHPVLTGLLEWARALEDEGLVRLYSYRGTQQTSLLPRLAAERAGLVTLWQNGTVTLWRGVFERRAGAFISRLEDLTGRPMGQGTAAGPVTPELLALLADAYRVAAS